MIETKLQEFVNNRLGKRVDVDNAYGYQCTDLSKKRAMELGIKPGTFNGAAKNANKNTFPGMKMYLPGPGNDLRPGDILQQQATATNPYGHTGIVVKVYADGYDLFNQNNGNGSGNGLGRNACRIDRFYWKSRSIVNFFRLEQNK